MQLNTTDHNNIILIYLTLTYSMTLLPNSNAHTWHTAMQALWYHKICDHSWGPLHIFLIKICWSFSIALHTHKLASIVQCYGFTGQLVHVLQCCKILGLATCTCVQYCLIHQQVSNFCEFGLASNYKFLVVLFHFMVCCSLLCNEKYCCVMYHPTTQVTMDE